MSVFVKTLSDIVALLLQALRLSVVLPASVFVGLNVAFILPLLKDTRLYHALYPGDTEFPLSATVFILVLLIAYALAVANIPIIRFFEGYSWLKSPWGRWMRDSHLRRVAYLQHQIAELESEMHNSQCDDDLAKARWCELQRSMLSAELSWEYPRHENWRMLPTRLGNVIAAAEEYPGQLYEGLDAVTFWPFLSPVLTEQGYAPFVEREKSAFDFLLNMTVMMIALGVEIVFLDAFVLYQFGVGSVLKLLIAVTLAFFFYLLSIQGALSWGYTIRTAFVLYRQQLRQKLGLRKPERFHEEILIWQDALRFYQNNEEIDGTFIFDYPSLDDKDSNST